MADQKIDVAGCVICEGTVHIYECADQFRGIASDAKALASGPITVAWVDHAVIHPSPGTVYRSWFTTDPTVEFEWRRDKNGVDTIVVHDRDGAKALFAKPFQVGGLAFKEFLDLSKMFGIGGNTTGARMISHDYGEIVAVRYRWNLRITNDKVWNETLEAVFGYP